MLRYIPFLVFLLSAVGALSCADDTVVQTGEISVKFDETVDFTDFQTFSVVTKDIADPPEELDPEHEAFNDYVNGLIVEAMQAEPVCLRLIPPEETSEQNQPHLWAANGLGTTEGDGYVYGCCGGWYWGYWGWYWDPCAYWCPTYVEYDVGNLLIPVGLPPGQSGDPVAVFAGLARSIAGTGADWQSKARYAVDQIFKQWPDKRTCAQ